MPENTCGECPHFNSWECPDNEGDADQNECTPRMGERQAGQRIEELLTSERKLIGLLRDAEQALRMQSPLTSYSCEILMKLTQALQPK